MTPPRKYRMSLPMFGIDLIDASLLPAMFVALAAGIISFLSPCVLPIVPPYLAYMSGTTLADLSAGDRRRNAAVVPAIFFVMGLSTIFLILGFAASVAGTMILQFQGYFNALAGITVMVFGLHFLQILRLPFLNREARIRAFPQGAVEQQDTRRWLVGTEVLGRTGMDEGRIKRREGVGIGQGTQTGQRNSPNSGRQPRGPNRMMAAPASTTAPPMKSHRSGVVPSMIHNHRSDAAT